MARISSPNFSSSLQAVPKKLQAALSSLQLTLGLCKHNNKILFTSVRERIAQGCRIRHRLLIQHVDFCCTLFSYSFFCLELL